MRQSKSNHHDGQNHRLPTRQAKFDSNTSCRFIVQITSGATAIAGVFVGESGQGISLSPSIDFIDSISNSRSLAL